MGAEADDCDEADTIEAMPLPAALCSPLDPCHVCGSSLFIVADSVGRVCMICDARIYSRPVRYVPVARLPAAHGANGYARTFNVVPASPSPRQT